MPLLFYYFCISVKCVFFVFSGYVIEFNLLPKNYRTVNRLQIQREFYRNRRLSVNANRNYRLPIQVVALFNVTGLET